MTTSFKLGPFEFKSDNEKIEKMIAVVVVPVCVAVGVAVCCRLLGADTTKDVFKKLLN
jgi:hypothetical protein